MKIISIISIYIYIYILILSLGLKFIFIWQDNHLTFTLNITVYTGILPVNASLPVNKHLIFLQYNRGQGPMLLYVN